MLWLSNMVALLSTIGAIITVIFSRKAVKMAEKSNSIALIVELHSIYHSNDIFLATQKVWELYKKYNPNADGKPIKNKQALQFVRDTDSSSADWKAVHELESFWRYVTLLVNLKYLDEEIAFGAFMSPRILGFLYPVEKVSLGRTYNYNKSLQKLFDHWNERKAKRK
ncbi:MAG TPA: hypothetical protein VGD14_12595 [bacterium]